GSVGMCRGGCQHLCPRGAVDGNAGDAGTTDGRDAPCRPCAPPGHPARGSFIRVRAGLLARRSASLSGLPGARLAPVAWMDSDSLLTVAGAASAFPKG